MTDGLLHQPERLLAWDAGHARGALRLEWPSLGRPTWLAGAEPGDRAYLAGRGLVRRRDADAGHHPDPLAGTDRIAEPRRPAADPLAQLAGAGAARDRLRRRLHRRGLDADCRHPA